MKYLCYTLIVFIASCQPTTKQEEKLPIQSTYQPPSHHNTSLTAVFDAHGGYEQWSKMKALSYKKGDEVTVTNLQNRKIKLEMADRAIGFDGENVWVAPDSIDASRARFYHNLYFYFYAMPFVVGDPGAFYEDMEPREILEKVYHGVKVSYGEGIGDAPDDNYIIWYDPDTKKMEWLMYTVTYRSGEPSEKYSLLKYNAWQENNDLILPTSLQWYTYKDDSVGEMRSEAIFEEIKIAENAPDESLFKMPDNAQIAPM